VGPDPAAAAEAADTAISSPLPPSHPPESTPPTTNTSTPPTPTPPTATRAPQCHRRSEGGRDVVYPVHAIAFHPAFGTFATGGGDGVINIWDGDNKKRLFQVGAGC
jgi:hypothetical protein